MVCKWPDGILHCNECLRVFGFGQPMGSFSQPGGHTGRAGGTAGGATHAGQHAAGQVLLEQGLAGGQMRLWQHHHHPQVRGKIEKPPNCVHEHGYTRQRQELLGHRTAKAAATAPGHHQGHQGGGCNIHGALGRGADQRINRASP